MSRWPEAQWQVYDNGCQQWKWAEMGDRRGSWSHFWRALYLKRVVEDGQGLLEFARPEQLLYTNVGRGGKIDQLLRQSGCQEFFEGERIVALYHQHGADELVHRALKDFGTEQLPFERFAPNAAYYYTMLVAFFLFEAFKEDVCTDLVPLRSYASTLRRILIDLAGKIVRHGRRRILKVARASWDQLNLRQLWERSGAAAPLG